MKEANNLTTGVLNYLNASGFIAWRQNNLAIKGRQFIGKKGVPDIIGFNRKSGIFVGVEIKIGGDTLSPEQKQMQSEMISAGCVHIVAKDFESFLLQIKQYA